MRIFNNKFVIIFSLLLLLFICLGSLAAANNEDNNLTDSSFEDNLEISNDAKLQSIDEDALKNTNNDVLSANTIIVDEVEEDHNEMTQSTIQKAINDAKAGDTIIINGKSYVHCHFVVNKKLTIISNVGTTMEVCPSSTLGSGYKGIFYISPSASGTVIQGFTIKNNVYNDEDYGILVSGASDVTINNCKITNNGYSDAIRVENSKNTIVENVELSNCANALNIKNSQDVSVKNSIIENSKNGINIIDSTRTVISSNIIINNNNAGVSFSGKGSYLTVNSNNISDNGNGISLTSSDNIYILSNYIAFNKNNGVYVDNDIVKIEIKGNFFNQNYKWEVFNDFHVTNLAQKGNSLEVINNNYMINYGGFGSADIDRPVWTQVYEYNTVVGDYVYDSSKDIYTYVGQGNGDYYGHQGIMFLGYVFEINEFVSCPNTYYAPRMVWAKTGNYELQLSEITQVKKGIYSISIVDANGNIATDISSVPVTFYLNKIGKTAAPQEGDVYKTVMMKDGTATVRFYMEEFNETGNVITAVLPTPGTNFDNKVSKTFAVDDAYIPGIPIETKVSVNSINTYPNSNQEIVATLTDMNGKAIVGETLTFTINSKNYNVITSNGGQAKLNINEANEGTYTLTVRYAGDGDVDYYGSSAQSTVTVKKSLTKITSSNINMIPKMAEYYSITLKDESGNALANQKVTFKVNGKTYTKTTNSNGVAKVKLKFNKNKKTYKIKITYNGVNQYKAVSKTNKIVVKYSSKKAKLTTPKLTIKPKTSTKYVISLKDRNGKGIAKQKVTIKIANKKYVKKTNKKGLITIKVKFSKFKTYKVSASYKGSKIYKKASSKGSIKVAKAATKITAPTVSTLPKQSTTYTVTLKSGNNALSKQKLTLKVNGKTYAKTTNSKGQVSLNLNFADENSYSVKVNYDGNGIYKSSAATGKINVNKIATDIISTDKTYSKDLLKDYSVSLKDASGNALSNHNIIFNYNGHSVTKTTDSNGIASINLNFTTPGVYDVETKYVGSDKYKEVSKINKITVKDVTNTVFVDNGLSNSEIQGILDKAGENVNVEFLGNQYFDISLIIKKSLNIQSQCQTALNAKINNPVFTISAENVAIDGFSINGNSGNAVVVENADGVNISDNIISNNLDESILSSYNEGIINLPGYGVSIINSSNVKLNKNMIKLFESGVFAQDSSKLLIDDNTLRENNYGIKYGFGVSNTQILNNEITENIGLYIMTVPEGPSGYGIFLNNSAVNVTINKNHIFSNHLGISLDANYSTGIVITQNTITDNVLEGMRFNAGYDLCENAVEPHVTDNAIYRNARGPSMMILGELSANPEGIYGGGLLNPNEKLQLEPNWYGTNNLVTWDNDTGVVGYGTMCPRINTTNIEFNMTYNSFGNYSIKFYKNGLLASNLPVFDMYATLNRGTDKQVEVVFDVVDGIGTFNFDSNNFNASNNKIEISIGSLINSTSRVFKVTYLYEVPESEIPI